MYSMKAGLQRNLLLVLIKGDMFTYPHSYSYKIQNTNSVDALLALQSRGGGRNGQTFTLGDHHFPLGVSFTPGNIIKIWIKDINCLTTGKNGRGGAERFVRMRGAPVFARLPTLSLANWYMVILQSDSDLRILSHLQISSGAFACTSGPWPPCLEGRREDPLDPVPVITLHNVNNIILLPSNTPNGQHLDFSC